MQAGGIGGDRKGGPSIMDNLVTFVVVAGPLAVFMIVVSGVEMYIERRVKQVHEQPEKSPRGRNAAAGGEGDRHNGHRPFAVRVREE